MQCLAALASQLAIFRYFAVRGVEDKVVGQ